MTELSTALREPKLYAKFPSSTSKDARENLPALVDEVVDTGQPVVIKKLNVGRAALIPARDLWIYEIIQRLKMDRGSVYKPIDELMKEVYERAKYYLETHLGDAAHEAASKGPAG